MNVALTAYLFVSECGYGIPLDELDRQLSLRHEQAIATWYSSLLYFLAGMLAIVIARVDRPQGHALASHTAPWWFVGLSLLALSADEIAHLHEWAGSYFTNRVGRSSFGWQLTSDAPGGSTWVLLLSPVLVVAAVVLLWTIWTRLREFPRSRILGCIAVVLWICVPLLEMREGQLRRDLIQSDWLTFMEEPMEIFGATLLIYAFCGRLGLEVPSDQCSAKRETS